MHFDFAWVGIIMELADVKREELQQAAREELLLGRLITVLTKGAGLKNEEWSS